MKQNGSGLDKSYVVARNIKGIYQKGIIKGIYQK